MRAIEMHYHLTEVDRIDHSQYKGWLCRTFGFAHRSSEFLSQYNDEGLRCYDRYVAFEKKNGEWDVFFKDEEFSGSNVVTSIFHVTRRDGAPFTAENIGKTMEILNADILDQQHDSVYKKRFGAGPKS